MPNRFEVTDPRGWHVTCSQNAWGHIIDARPWMDTEEWQAILKQAVETPTMGIYQDNEFTDRHVYYMLRVIKKKRYVKVVVRIVGTELGEIVTAYPVLTPKAGEKLLWPTSKV